MTTKELKSEIYNILTSLEVCKEDNDGVYIRCPKCGDSIKNEQSAHCHVKIDISDDSVPLIFHCFRCDESGIFDSNMLKELGYYNLNINSNLRSYNKAALKNINTNPIKSIKYTHKKNIAIHDTKNIELANKKLKYIENRLGIPMTIDEALKLKILLNFADYFKANPDIKIRLNNKFITNLHNEYVSFISTNNDFIQCRRINENQKYRYYNYNVFNSIDKSRNFYTIPNKINLLTTDCITIVLAEGVFDILGAYYNIFNQQKENHIYSAVCGCGFKSVLQYYLRQGIVGENVNVIILSDSDKPPYFYTKIIKELLVWVNSIKVFYNTLNKDYGVTKDKINLVEEVIPYK